MLVWLGTQSVTISKFNKEFFTQILYSCFILVKILHKNYMHLHLAKYNTLIINQLGYLSSYF